MVLTMQFLVILKSIAINEREASNYDSIVCELQIKITRISPTAETTTC